MPAADHSGRAAMIKLKRVYDPVSRTDGPRFLVERLWPRGVSKESLRLTQWLKEAGPSTELRRWFRHDPLKWSQFRTRYFRELDSRPESDPHGCQTRRRDARVQLARRGTQQCRRTEGVPAGKAASVVNWPCRRAHVPLLCRRTRLVPARRARLLGTSSPGTVSAATLSGMQRRLRSATARQDRQR